MDGCTGNDGWYVDDINVYQCTTGGPGYLRGDFNSDGKTDILWRHDVSGENVAWFMNGATLTTGTFLTPAALPDVRWKMVGTHDFNADNKTDILWRHDVSGENVLWYMNGTVLASGEFLTPAALVDTDWKMAGTGLFDAGAQPDIVFHHQVSGQIVVWYMNGSVLTTGTFTTPSSLPDTNWRLRGVSDFNNDGHPDLLWHNQSSGQILVWYMDNATKLSETLTNPSSEPDTGWQIVAVGDYSVPLDGKPDIVWRKGSTGQNRIWFMDGVTRTSEVSTTALPDADWKLVGPR